MFRTFAENIQRPFGVKYNPYTQTVDVLSNAKRITAAVSELRGDLSIVSSALRKVSALDQDLDVQKITQMLQAGLQVNINQVRSPTGFLNDFFYSINRLLIVAL